MKKFLFDNKWYIFALGGILAIYTAMRLFNITVLPMFTDEAIYTRWSQIAMNDANWRFISLTDGKQPSFVWADMVLMRFVDDPLLAGRLVSVIAGFITTIGMFFLGTTMFRSRKVGIAAAALYVLYPFALVYDRMALYDSMVAMFITWGMVFTVLMVRHLRLDTALILGLIAGGGVLTKTNAFFTIYLLPFSLLLLDWTKKGRRRRIVKFAALGLVATLLTFGVYQILRLSPYFYIIGEKNASFVYPLSEWLEHPTKYAVSNVKSLFEWAGIYLSLPVVALIIGSFFVSRKFFLEKVYLAAFFTVSIIGLGVFGKVIFPRFIFFMTIPLVVLAAYTLVVLLIKRKHSLMRVVIVGAAIAWWVWADYLILTDFSRAPIPDQDISQYSNGWPAGGGYRQLVEFVEEKSANEKIFVATEGTFGSLPTYTIEIYHGENKNVEKQGYYPLPPEIPQELLTKLEEMPVYFVFNETQDPPEDAWPIELVEKYRKGAGDDYMRIYRVTPQDE